MKKFFYATMCIMSLFLSGCGYDDDEVWNAINDQEERIAALEEWQKTANENIAALQAIVNGNDYITSVEEIKEGDEVIGYTINFYRQGEVTIYNGKDGEKGDMPVISVTESEDGRWYWTVNGELLEDANGNPVCASGKDGEDGEDGEDGQDGADGEDGQPGSSGSSAPIPQVKTENGDVYLSVDGGKTWTKINGEDGSNGDDGDSFFSDVIETGSSVIFKLATGESITVPKSCATLYCVMNSTREDIANGKLIVPLNQSFKIVCETINGLECSAEVVKGNLTITRYKDSNNSYIVSVDAISSSGSSTILFTVVAEDNQAFFYQVEVKALDDEEMAEYYLDTIEEHVSTMESAESLDAALNELAAWIGEQPYIKEVSVSQNENFISFTFTNGKSSFVAFEDYEEYYADSETILSNLTISTLSRSESASSNVFVVTDSGNNEMIIQNNRVLCYAPLKWKPYLNTYEHDLFFEIIKNSPVDLAYVYDNSGLFNSIKEFGTYGNVLVAETHCYGGTVDGELASSFAIPYEINGEELGYLYGLVFHEVPFDMAAKGWDSYEYYLISDKRVKSVSGLYNNDNNPLYSVLACNSFLQQNACAPTSNFIGLINKSSRYYIMSIIEDYYTGLFNGLTHEQSIARCDQKSNDDHDTQLCHLDFFKNQRYFSITTNDVTPEDAKKFTSVPVSAKINGYKNLKAGIEYKIYYCEGDKEFNVTDEGVLSEEVEVDKEGNIEHQLTSLEAEKTYSCRIGFEYAGKYYYGARKSFTTGASGAFVAGEAVDLGLSVKWANYNVGASKPEEYGGHYGCYCYRQYAGGNPPDDISGSEWDYARIAWGSPWRMPTHGEMSELIEKCAWEIDTENGVRGAKVTGPNGNAIFLPFTGFRFGDTYRLQNEIGHYWTSTLDVGTSTRHRSCDLLIDGRYVTLGYKLQDYSGSFIYAGYSIRPVRD